MIAIPTADDCGSLHVPRRCYTPTSIPSGQYHSIWSGCGEPNPGFQANAVVSSIRLGRTAPQSGDEAVGNDGGFEVLRAGLPGQQSIDTECRVDRYPALALGKRNEDVVDE
jgi:hypothetical protein